MRSFRSRWPDSVVQLANAGFSTDDAYALRRISMTLHRWHELECGDGNEHGSWCITRGTKLTGATLRAQERGAKCNAPFLHDDDGKPYLEHHHYMHGKGKDYISYTPLADRERGARKRLDAIMARYPGFASYVQGDPRGASLYIIPLDKLNTYDAANLDTCYNRGIAVYK